MTSVYTITIPAPSAPDAQDIARRRARDDGYRTLRVRRVHLTGSGKWTVELAVVRREA